ncbi:Lrp/AsnC family transcriptional regulator [Caulobacter sp. 602-2]|uniref:Lrp/AsnC family transcriptional regulator n=1 Tax=Caulobacter sp. 602-2 TaxID=2710887 RepID=A0A6G4R2D8_9CAUL|nr:Lrp/AsnC family transcriptional regulator [Caulobacter sp. 602-2]NGM51744.1 Lrp/AsnC family transcriptional regulator [Caulobacter sp. 602-2]
MKLDDIDRRILRELQKDGRIQNAELAKRVGLSPSPCLRRVKILEEAGVIARYVAVLDAAKVGRGQTFFTRIWLNAQHEDAVDHFVAEVNKLPEVVECYVMLGDCDMLLRVVAADIADYRRFQADHLSRIRGVLNVKTDVPAQTVKQTFAVPL